MNDDKGTEKLNFSISAYRVLYILLLLIQHRSLSLDKLNQYLLDNPLIERTYNSETITKYVNTLRRVGCEIPRANSGNNFHYELTKNPFPIALNEEKIKAAQQLLLLLASQPDEELHIRYHQFLQKVAWAVSNDKQEWMLFNTDDILASPSVKARRELLAKYKSLCLDAMVLEIAYQVDGDEIISLSLEPNRVLTEGQRLFLLGLDRKNYQKIKLNLEKIISCKQLPFKAQNRTKQMSVVFEVSGRLSKTYRLYPNETILSQTDSLLRIKARTDDYKSLLKRLLKYSSQCEVISPSYVRQEMKALIDTMLHTCEYGTSSQLSIH
jgi:predicted DNA-binding transcriptional regulator YafY